MTLLWRLRLVWVSCFSENGTVHTETEKLKEREVRKTEALDDTNLLNFLLLRGHPASTLLPSK